MYREPSARAANEMSGGGGREMAFQALNSYTPPVFLVFTLLFVLTISRVTLHKLIMRLALSLKPKETVDETI